MALGDLRRMLDPKAVSVIGATAQEGSMGRTILENLLRSKDRRVYPVNPTGKRVMELPAFRSIASIGQPIDLAVIATPVRTVPAIVEQCAQAGVPGVAVMSGGFRELGEEGKKLEAEIGRIGKKYGMRVMGPNCLGFVRPGAGLNATFMEGQLPEGNIAFLSQSGALGGAMARQAAHGGIGFSMVAALGSMIDVDFGDLIDYLGGDETTRSILIYMERVGNAKKFMSAARAFARRKPVIVFKPGRFRRSEESAWWQSKLPVGSDAVYEAAFRRVGVVRVRYLSDLVEAAGVLDSQKLPRGPRLAIVTSDPGSGLMAVDPLVDLGGEPARLSDETIEEIAPFLPPRWRNGSPVDVQANVAAAGYGKVVTTCLRDPSVDGLLVIYVPAVGEDPNTLADEVARLTGKSGKPLLTAWMGAKEVEKGRSIFIANSVPTYETPEEAVRAYLTMYRYRRNLDELYETPAELPGCGPSDKFHLQSMIRHALAEGRTTLQDEEGKAFLKAFGIATAMPRPEMDYRLVLRLRPDEEFGSIIIFGMGGTEGEVFDDFSIGLPPLNQTLAKMLLEEIRVYRILQGSRDGKPANMEELEKILVCFSNLIVEFPEIAEIDIDPLAMSDGHPYALSARVTIHGRHQDHASPYPHLVITPYPTRYVTAWRLPNGTEVLLRPIKPEDEPLEQEMAATLSAETIRTRFFSSVREFSHEWMVFFCNIDYDRHVAIVAEITEKGKRKIIGVSRLIMDPDFRSGEFAILVHDRYQRLGLGYKLMEMIIAVGRDKGLEEIVGDVLSENDKMLSLARKLGFSVKWIPGGTDRVTLRLKHGPAPS